MNEFETLISSQALPIYFGIISAVTIVLAAIASNFKPHAFATVLIALVGIFVNIFVSAIVLYAVAVGLEGSRVLTATVANASGASAYFLETGIEFSVVTIPISILLFIWIQRRKRQKLKASPIIAG